jgi:hypothetical protein
MAIKMQACGDTIRINKAFVSGKDRIAVNDNVVFEGKLSSGSPQKVSAGSREYSVESRRVGKMTGATAIHLEVYERGELIHAGVYDQNGKSVENEGQAKANGAMQTCAMIGAVAGFTTMMSLNMATGVVPGGAIGGAIGGGVGGMLGAGVGTLLFGKRKN